MSTCALFTRFSHRFCKLRQNIEVSRCVRKTHKYPHVSSEKASSKFNTIYRDLHGAIEDSTSARDFIYALKQQERTLLLNELQTFENERIKASGKMSGRGWIYVEHGFGMGFDLLQQNSNEWPTYVSWYINIYF